MLPVGRGDDAEAKRDEENPGASEQDEQRREDDAQRAQRVGGVTVYETLTLFVQLADC